MARHRNTSRSYHDRNGNLWKTVDPLGRVGLTEYDNTRRKVKATAPEGNFTSWTYDAKSNVLSTAMTPKPGSPPALLPKTTSATYNALCNLAVTETDEMGRVTDTALNTTTCKVTSVTQPQVNPPSNTTRPVTSYTYNGFGQVLTKTDPTGLVTQTTYHATNGNVLSVILNPGTAPNIAATTVFAYDTAANVTQITDPRGFVHTATYDAMRRLTSYTAPTSTNAKTKWTYDADGLVVKIERASNAAQTTWAATDYTYWPTGRVRTMTDADGRVTRYSYDALNRLSVTTDAENRQTQKIYDAAGQTIEDHRAVGTPQEQVYATFSYTPNGKQAWKKRGHDTYSPLRHRVLQQGRLTRTGSCGLAAWGAARDGRPSRRSRPLTKSSLPNEIRRHEKYSPSLTPRTPPRRRTPPPSPPGIAGTVGGDRRATGYQRRFAG